MSKESEADAIGEMAFAPGWEREHGADYADYLDALLDPTDPLHAAAVGTGESAAGVTGVEESPDFIEAVRVLGGAKRILVFTGAGISTESGIPDFRGNDGLWTRLDPSEFSLGAFLESPEARIRHWKMLLDSRLVDGAVEPNAAHFAIADLARAGRLAGCVTQNVDGLHQAAGLSDDQVAELHGNARNVTCMDCQASTHFEAFRVRLDNGEVDPRCVTCGGVLKPAMVMFGELLPPGPMQRAAHMAFSAEAVLAVGSTLSIYPAASVVAKTARRGKPLVIVNQGATEHDILAVAKLDGPAGTVLPALIAALLGERQ